MTIFSLVFLAVFVRLGIWQLAREDEKVALLAAQSEQRNQPPITLAEAIKRADRDLHLAPISTRGRYDRSSVFLLDNRVLNGEVGFEVLVPFEESSSGARALVNRGFVPMARTRQQMPSIPPLPEETVMLQGRVYVGDYRDVPTGEVAAPLDRFTVVQLADPQVIEAIAGADWFRHLIRLSIEDPQALPRHWPVTVMQPEKHRGYAVQWFLMALAVLIAWIAFTVSDNRNRNQTEVEKNHG